MRFARAGKRMTSRVLMCYTKVWRRIIGVVHADCCPANHQPITTLTLEMERGGINSAEVKMQHIYVATIQR